METVWSYQRRKRKEKMTYMTLGEKIKFRRHVLGLSQVELAKKSGVGQSYISELENGKFNPTSKYLPHWQVRWNAQQITLFLTERKQDKMMTCIALGFSMLICVFGIFYAVKKHSDDNKNINDSLKRRDFTSFETALILVSGFIGFISFICFVISAKWINKPKQRYNRCLPEMVYRHWRGRLKGVKLWILKNLNAKQNRWYLKWQSLCLKLQLMKA